MKNTRQFHMNLAFPLVGLAAAASCLEQKGFDPDTMPTPFEIYERKESGELAVVIGYLSNTNVLFMQSAHGTAFSDLPLKEFFKEWFPLSPSKKSISNVISVFGIKS